MCRSNPKTLYVIPANAGISKAQSYNPYKEMPAFAGMTM